MKMQKVTITVGKVGSVTMFTIHRDVNSAFVAIATNSDLTFKDFSGNGYNSKAKFEHIHDDIESLDEFIKAVFKV